IDAAELSPDHPNALDAIRKRGTVRVAQGRADEGVGLLRQALGRLEATRPPDFPLIPAYRLDLAAALLASGDAASARSMAAGARSALADARGPDDPRVAAADALIGEIALASCARSWRPGARARLRPRSAPPHRPWRLASAPTTRRHGPPARGSRRPRRRPRAGCRGAPACRRSAPAVPPREQGGTGRLHGSSQDKPPLLCEGGCGDSRRGVTHTSPAPSTSPDLVRGLWRRPYRP
ncbi:MAG: hypothetical protein AAFQ43_13905, partial [Bacteroidota bacterium]